jgi:PAT family beta-lactamase induction signal transducer AmpG
MLRVPLPGAGPSPAGVQSHPPLWLFGLAVVAGAVTPFATVAMPFLLRREGIAVETIAGISALATLPFTLMIVWSPLADMLLSRRHWVVVGNLISAGLLLAAILMPRPQYLALFTALLVAANVAFTLAFIALGGLMAVLVPDGVRGRSAAWFQAGNLGSLPLLGGLALWLIEEMTLTHAAVAIALVAFLPSLAVLFIKEPPRSVAPSRAVFGEMFHEIRILLPRRQTWLGLLLFLSPLAAGAAYNLFSGIGVDYQASPRTVLLVTGLPGGVIAMVAGAFIGGAISDRVPRRTSYVLCGSVMALAAAAMAVAPILPGTFAIGALAYQVSCGMSWAAFSALALELSGADPMTAGTRMALFTSASAAAASYMTWLDGAGDQAWGVRGLLGTDALLGLVSAAMLVVLFRVLKEPLRSTSARAVAEAAAAPPLAG